MFGCAIGVVAGCPSLIVSGRLDGVSAPAVQRSLDTVIAGGARQLVADLSGVTFISSAGLRVLLQAQKQLRKVDGELILYRVPPPALDTLRMSGLTTIFRQAASPEEIAAALEREQPAGDAGSWEQEGLSLRYIARKAGPGELEGIGDTARLALSGYEEADVVAVPASRYRYGTGLATIGTSYEEYRELFGEAVILGGHFFFYPAVRYPAADFMLAGEEATGSVYRFLHGFGFNGPFSRVAAFHGADGPVELGALVRALLSIAGAPRIGIVLLAESKGLWGMHLKQTPIREHRPENGQDIFSADNFPDWINYPLEPGDFGHVLAGAGVAVADAAAGTAAMKDIVPAGKNFHLHGAVFSKEPLSQKAEVFEEELQRIVTELPVLRVLHIQGQPRPAIGLAGIIPLG